MKIIGKMTGLRLLEEIINNNLSCGTMVRCKNQSVSDAMEIPIYDYYIFTKGDGRFHRCDEKGKLGAKGQKRFMGYSTLKKEFEILEIIEEEKDIEELNKNLFWDSDYKLSEENYQESGKRITVVLQDISDKVDELVRKVNKLNKEEK